MKSVAGNIFGLLVIVGIVIFFIQEAKKPVKKTKLV